jgi:hypothetical protein
LATSHELPTRRSSPTGKRDAFATVTLKSPINRPLSPESALVPLLFIDALDGQPEGEGQFARDGEHDHDDSEDVARVRGENGAVALGEVAEGGHGQQCSEDLGRNPER